VPQFAYDFGSKYALDNGKRCYLWSTRAMWILRCHFVIAKF
jgi:hypothetical protein